MKIRSPIRVGIGTVLFESTGTEFSDQLGVEGMGVGRGADFGQKLIMSTIKPEI